MLQDGAGGGNLGTFENPSNTNMFPATQATDLLYLHGGGGPYVNGYVLDAGQRFLGEGAGNTHLINTDQFGPVLLPPGSGGFVRPVVQGTLTASNGSEISNVAFAPIGTGIELVGLTGPVNVNRSTIDNGMTGIAVMGGSGDFVFADVAVSNPTVAGISITGGSSNVTFGTVRPVAPAVAEFAPSSITQTGMGSVVTIGGGHTGTFLTNAESNLTATNGTGLQFDDADGTYDFKGNVTLNGEDAGIDILGDSAGTFTFADTTIVSPSGTAINIDGLGGTSTANFNFTGGAITQANNATTVNVNNHSTGTVVIDPVITATNGTGLQFNNADSIYNFNGNVTLNGGDAGIDILGDSAGTFTFADTSIVNPTGTALNIDGLGSTSTAAVNHTGGVITQTNNAATINVRNHSTRTVVVNPNIQSTNGSGFQFNNADGIYDVNGNIQLNGGDNGIDILTGSDGIFTFARTTIVNTAGGIGVNIVGGNAQTTLEGGSITTTGNTGLNVNGTGLTTILPLTDITSTNGAVVDILNTQVNMRLRNVTSNGSPTEGIDIDGASAGSSFAVDGTAIISNAVNAGIDIANSQGTFTFANTDIDGTGGHGVNLTNNPNITSVTLSRGQIDGTPLDGVHIENTNEVTVSDFLLGFINPIAGDGVDYASNGGIARVRLANIQSNAPGDVVGRGIAIAQMGVGQVNAGVTGNSLVSGGQPFVTTDSGNVASLILQLGNNTWTTSAGDFASDVTGSGANSTIVTSAGDSAFGRGLLFDRVTFDASGALLGGTQAQAVGTTTVGSPFGPVTGDGLSFINPTGDLNIGSVNITNTAGTGLEVFTKGLGTTFNLQIGTSGNPVGSITTSGGNAMFLDPLTGSINVGTVTSTNSIAGGAPTAVSSSTGDGIFVDAFSATGGSGNVALQITNFNATDVAGHGARIQNSQGQFNLGTVDIDGTGLDAVSLVDNGGLNTRVSIAGGAIRDTPAMVDAINSLNTALTVNNVTLGGEMDEIGGDGIEIQHNDGVNRQYVVNNVDSFFTMNTADILGRAIVIEKDAASTGTLAATLSNNDVQSVGTALHVRTGMNMNANIASVNIASNTFQTTVMMVPPNPTIDLLGNALAGDANSLRVTGFSNNVVTGNAVGGGARIEQATFQPMFGMEVAGGTTTIGEPGARVAGDGLALIDISGNVNFDILNIANEDGVGLLVDTKVGGTNFTLGTGGGTIDTVGGPAMFLDPLEVNMMLDAVVSSASVIGPGISNGDGVTLQDVVGNLTIADLQVSNAMMEGLELSQAAGTGGLNLTLEMIVISATGSHGILVNDAVGPNNTNITIGSVDMEGMFTGGTINATVGDGININNVDGFGSQFTLFGTTFSAIGGTTGTITNSRITGDGNIDAAFNPGPIDPASTGVIQFNDGTDQLQ